MSLIGNGSQHIFNGNPIQNSAATRTQQNSAIGATDPLPSLTVIGVNCVYSPKMDAISRDNSASFKHLPHKRPSLLTLLDPGAPAATGSGLAASTETTNTEALTTATTAMTPVSIQSGASIKLLLLSPPQSHIQTHRRGLSLQESLDKPLPLPPRSPFAPSLTPISQARAFIDSLPASARRTQPPSPQPDADTLLNNLLESQYGSARRPRFFIMDSSMPLSSGVYGSHTDSQYDSQGHLDTGSRHYGPSQSPLFNQQPRTPNSGTGAGPSETQGSQNAASAHLSGLMCNVHKTTGREPHPLVGVTTMIVGDKLYVFGGRHVSRNRQGPLTSAMYELDLISRHWTKLSTTGDIPTPRYFHSMCALGDTKMVCYGGMAALSGNGEDPPTVVSDVYIYDIPTKHWTFIPVQGAPQGRYAHCATVLSSSAVFTSNKASLSALQHNLPFSSNPNEGRIGINVDGTGGAEMIILGGQDANNHYIEEISVFNLRSLKWTSTEPLGKSCGAYRSVVAALPPSVAHKVGRPQTSQRPDTAPKDAASSMLIYSNYNFLDVKLELQIRAPDGTLTEKIMSGAHTPPGLRFPNGGIIDTHFVVSGTYLTSSKQEYALWALNLRTLTWSRIDAGGTVFSHGSWNKGILWNRRNTFVILGNRKRSLVEDYNHRRINFSNVCMVELEAFGFYDNPRRVSPMSGFISASSPYTAPSLSLARKAGYAAGGRQNSRAADELGEKLLGMKEVADMDILCIEGERIPINSRLVSRRWGPYFNQLLREGTTTQDTSDSVTLRSGMSGTTMRSLAITSSRSTASESTLVSMASGGNPLSTSASNVSNNSANFGKDVATHNSPTPRSLNPTSRPRCLYLPHTSLTVQALVHYLYTSSLPPPNLAICTPQILCSLLQIARPYKVDGLLEAVVERLHMVLDSRNAAAVFNATAMAAGGGRGIDGSLNPNYTGSESELTTADGMNGLGQMMDNMTFDTSRSESVVASRDGLCVGTLRINTSVNTGPSQWSSQENLSATTSVSGSEWSSELGDGDNTGAGGFAGEQKDVWTGELSSVIGLQKRGLRGLMEGRRMRERTGTSASISGPSGGIYGQQARVGLGIAGP